jgi:hypothetical protein
LWRLGRRATKPPLMAAVHQISQAGGVIRLEDVIGVG